MEPKGYAPNSPSPGESTTKEAPAQETRSGQEGPVGLGLGMRDRAGDAVEGAADGYAHSDLVPQPSVPSPEMALHRCPRQVDSDAIQRASGSEAGSTGMIGK